jgi:predicted P-loop ATPase
LKLSLYPLVKDSRQTPTKVLDFDWDDLVDYIGGRGWLRDPDIATRREYADKLDVPLWSGHVLKEGKRRHDSNVESIHIVALDFDDNANIEDVDWAFGDWQRLVHTTWQHTPYAPRCRVILPLRRPVKPGEEFDKVMKFLVDHAYNNGLAADPACKDEARMYFLPSCPPDQQPSYKYVYANQGDLVGMLDPDTILQQRQKPGQTRTASERPGGSITVRTEDGEIDVLEWARATPFDPNDQKNTKVKCACPFKDGASMGSAFLRRVRTGAVVVCTSQNHGHAWTPYKWFYGLGDGDVGEHDIFNAKPDQSVVPKLQKDVDKNTGETGKVLNTAGNLGCIITSDFRFKEKPWYNEFTHMFMFGDVLLEDMVGEKVIQIEAAYGLRQSPERLKMFLQAEAIRRKRNPLVEWIERLPDWDGQGRIDTFLVDVFGVEDNELHRAMGSKWLISAIGRALKPGCKVDTMLVVSGPQGIGKSTVFRNLCPTQDEIGISVFSDASIDVESDNACRLVSQAWIVEFAEFKDIRAKEVEAVKQFLTRQYDEWVPKYKEDAHKFPRHAVFCGTTNERDVLVDTTGNRRFLMCEAQFALADYVREVRDQLWAEALWRYRNWTGARDPWVLTSDEDVELAKSNKLFEQDDALEQALLEYLVPKEPRTLLTVGDIWRDGLKKQGTPSKGEARLLGKVMRKIVGEPKQQWVNGKNLKRWEIPLDWKDSTKVVELRPKKEGVK